MKKDSFQLTKKLDHIAFIMDGNGRWAKKRGLSRSSGHKAGVNRISEIIDQCFFTYNIKTVSLYCFSTENWNRPEKEISYLFSLLKKFFENNLEDFKSKQVRIAVSGDLLDSRIPQDILDVIYKCIEETKSYSLHTFNVLFNYGGRRELVFACKNIVKNVQSGVLDLNDIDEAVLQDSLYQKDIGDVDLLIRTSGEERISNCLLYELAYAEFIFTQTYWPDFNKKKLKECLEIYQNRNRRFGGLKNE